jgi:hypothetical protein
MWSDHDRIQPHAKHKRREHPGSRPEKKENGVHHFVCSRAAGGAQDDENISNQLIVSTDTLHVVGSY